MAKEIKRLDNRQYSLICFIYYDIFLPLRAFGIDQYHDQLQCHSAVLSSLIHLKGFERLI